MKICIIGAGNMGGAVARGLVASGKFRAKDISLTAGHKESLAQYEPEGFRLTTDNKEAIKGAELIMVAVKPATVFPVIDEIAPLIDTERQCVVCIAAGMNPDEFLKHLDEGCERVATAVSDNRTKADLVYVIPNTGSEISKGVSFITAIRDDHHSAARVSEVFSAVGSVRTVDLKGLTAGMVLSSCGIAYAMKYIQSCIEVGESLGFSAQEAREIVLDTVGGAAQLLKYRKTSPKEEIRRVATPGGHTEKGLNRMEADGFTKTIKAAMLDSE